VSHLANDSRRVGDDRPVNEDASDPAIDDEDK